MVAIDASRRPPRYKAVIAREEAQMSQARAVLDKVYGGDLIMMMSNAVGAGSYVVRIDAMTGEAVEIQTPEGNG